MNESIDRCDPLRALRIVYDELDAEIARLAPRCELSGRCCRFKAYGHTLFITTVEADYLLEYAPTTARGMDDGATCPWQNESGRCEAREGRPLGCRVFFCDADHQEKAVELTERFLTRIRSITRDSNRPWNYAPLHVHLAAANEAGRLDRKPERSDRFSIATEEYA